MVVMMIKTDTAGSTASKTIIPPSMRPFIGLMNRAVICKTTKNNSRLMAVSAIITVRFCKYVSKSYEKSDKISDVKTSVPPMTNVT